MKSCGESAESCQSDGDGGAVGLCDGMNEQMKYDDSTTFMTTEAI